MELGYITIRRVIFIFGCSGHGSRDGDVSVSLLGHSNKNTTGGRSKRSMCAVAEGGGGLLLPSSLLIT